MLKHKSSPATCGRDSAQGAGSELTEIIGYIKKAVCKSKKLITFAVEQHYRKARLMLAELLRRLFLCLCLKYNGFVPPCGVLMHPEPFEVLFNGTGKAVFLCLNLK